MNPDSVGQERWSSRAGFLMAAVGFSVGLGNIWRFPYVTGENGGGAFLVIYLVGAFGIAYPLLIGELVIGRRGRLSAAGSLRRLAREAGHSERWGAVGGLAVFCVFAVLSFYTVIAGWTIDYFFRSLTGHFVGLSAEASSSAFAGLLASPTRMLFWHSVVVVATVLILRRGLRAGIERAVSLLMPALFSSLVVLVGYAAVTADLDSTYAFLLVPDFSQVTLRTATVAVGQAFFSIGIALASLMTFGAYLDRDVSLPRSAAMIVGADTLAALLAGFAIFPIVFAAGLEPSSGPGLLFQALPFAFGQMPGGAVFGSIFFFLLIAAALTSCFGAMESVIAWADEHWGIARGTGAVLSGVAVWTMGIFWILSFNVWSDFYPLDFIPTFAGKTVFEVLDFTAANILLLLGGLLTSIFLGYKLPRGVAAEESGLGEGLAFTTWRFTVRYVAPAVLLVLLIAGLME